MKLCKISPLSNYHKYYPDTIFIVTGYDNNMVNLKYIRSKNDICFRGITIPTQDITVIQLNENNCPDCGNILKEKWSGVKCDYCGYWDCL